MLSLHYNEAITSYLLIPKKMHQFKVKKLEIKPYSLGLGNISKVAESIT